MLGKIGESGCSTTCRWPTAIAGMPSLVLCETVSLLFLILYNTVRQTIYNFLEPKRGGETFCYCQRIAQPQQNPFAIPPSKSILHRKGDNGQVAPFREWVSSLAFHYSNWLSECRMSGGTTCAIHFLDSCTCYPAPQDISCGGYGGYSRTTGKEGLDSKTWYDNLPCKVSSLFGT